MIYSTEQHLPYFELSPLQFEELSFWLLEARGHTDVEHWGAAGNEKGCDLVSRDPDGNRWVTQCKRVQSFRKTEALKELQKVLDEPPNPPPKVYFLVGTCPVSRTVIEALKKKLDGAMELKTWDLTKLDKRVREHPDVVKRFFGVGPTTPGVRPSLEETEVGQQRARSPSEETGKNIEAKVTRSPDRCRSGLRESDISQKSVYSITDPIEKTVVSVLKAEVERYRKCGRPMGGLGSLTRKGAFRGVRELDIAANPCEGAVRSDNADALVSAFSQLSSSKERRKFVEALISRIARDTEYSSVGYLIALVLFRIGYLLEGLTKAKSDMVGDRHYGFSDFLRVIDYLLAFEHLLFSDALLDDIERTMEEIEEDLFRIPQRIVAIRAFRLRQNTAP